MSPFEAQEIRDKINLLIQTVANQNDEIRKLKSKLSTKNSKKKSVKQAIRQRVIWCREDQTSK